MEKTPERDKPSEKFRKAMRQILSIPKTELERRETEYRANRSAKRAKRTKQ